MMANEIRTIGVLTSGGDANREIVDSISLLSAASEEVSAGTQTCKFTIDNAFDNLNIFSKTVDGTFGQLQSLKEATEM